MKYDKETKQIIADLDKQAKEIQAKIDELKSGECSKNVNIRWRAGINTPYRFLSDTGEILNKYDHRDFEDDYRYSIGNYFEFIFKSQEEAEQYKNNLIITQKLKDIALRLNDGVEIDWANSNQPKWFIYFDGKNLDNNYTHIAKALDIYCLSDKFLETAIKEIGEKELIEYIKGC